MTMEADLPKYPDTREISINDNNLLRNLFSIFQPKISEYTFTNLWVWKGFKPVFLSRLDTTVLIMREVDGKLFLLPPIGELNITEIFEKIKESRIVGLKGLFGISKEETYQFRKKDLTIESNRGNWDYVYSVEDLAYLRGSRYRKKRQNVNQCLSNYECDYKPFTHENIDECKRLQKEWYDLKGNEMDDSLKAENEAIEELLEAYEEIRVFGGTIYINDRLEAFTIAERLNKDTAVIHFEKANPEVRGLYQVINQWFCKNGLREYVFINREQDLGREGLRRAKEEYYPHHMVEKHLVMF